MEIIQIAAIAIVAAVLSLIFQGNHKEYGLYIGIVAGVLIFFRIAGYLGSVIESLRGITEKTGLEQSTVLILFKIIGIGYITEFASQICKDAGQGAIGLKVEMAGKILIIVISMPIFMTLIDTLTGLLA